MAVLAHAVSLKLAPPRLVRASHDGSPLLIDSDGNCTSGLPLRDTARSNVAQEATDGDAYSCPEREEVEQREEACDERECECDDKSFNVLLLPLGSGEQISESVALDVPVDGYGHAEYNIDGREPVS